MHRLVVNESAAVHPKKPRQFLTPELWSAEPRQQALQLSLRRKIIGLRMSTAGVVIAHPFCDSVAQFAQRLCIQQKRAILFLEAAEEGFHFRVIPCATPVTTPAAKLAC